MKPLDQKIGSVCVSAWYCHSCVRVFAKLCAAFGPACYLRYNNRRRPSTTVDTCGTNSSSAFDAGPLFLPTPPSRGLLSHLRRGIAVEAAVAWSRTVFVIIFEILHSKLPTAKPTAQAPRGSSLSFSPVSSLFLLVYHAVSLSLSSSRCLFVCIYLSFYA